MIKSHTQSQFKAKLLRPMSSGDDTLRAFVLLPKSASEKLPRRGRTTVEGTINRQAFTATLEPDGQLSHWLPLDEKLLETIHADMSEMVALEIMSVEKEPEPEVPFDLADALAHVTKATTVWNETTTLARVDWIHWIESAKQAKTRSKRIADACEMLASGKRRVCCFDPSGFYSKALSAPKVAD